MSWSNWKTSRVWRALLLAVPGFILLLLVRATGLLEPSALGAYDTFNRWMAEPGSSQRTVVVGFSESDFKFAATYPYPDAMLAKLLDRILSAQPRMIYLNVLRDIPVEPGHAELLEVYRRAPMLYGFDTAMPGEAAEAAAPPVLREAGRFGFAKSVVDNDGITRSALLGDSSTDPIHEHAVVKAARHALADEGVTLELSKDGSLVVGSRRFSLMRWAKEKADLDWSPTWIVHQIPYRYMENPPQVSFEAVLTGQVDLSIFKNRSVVIGTTASSMARLSETPLSQANSVGVTSPAWIAHSLDNLYAVALDGWPVQQELSPMLELVGLFLLAWLACWSFLGVASLTGWALRAGCWAVILIGSAYLAFRAGWWLPLVPALATLVLVVGLVLHNLLRAEAAQRHLISFFERVLDQIPDPIYVLDDRDRFRLVNRAFSQLALKRPKDLLNQASTDLLGPLKSAQSGASERTQGEREMRVPGARQQLTLSESSMQDARGRQLKIGIVQAVQAIRTTDPAQTSVLAAQGEERFAAAAYWADQQQTSLALLLVEPADPGLLESAFGRAEVPNILAAMNERLERAFPDAVVRLQPTPGQNVLLVARRIDNQASAQSLVSQAFSWPLQTLLGEVDLDVRMGCAWHGQDGRDLASLLSIAQARRVELLGAQEAVLLPS